MNKSNQLFFKKVLYSLLLILVAGNVFIWKTIVFSHESGNLEMDFLDVGQGDSELINFPNDVQVLIDGGPTNGKLLSALGKVLRPADHYIDILLITHPQLDHFGGFIDVLKNYKVGAVIDNGRKGTARAYADFEKALKENGAKHIILAEGDQVRYEDAVFRMLGPSRSGLRSKELNDTCLVVMLEKGGLRALYTGDIGQNIEDELIKKYNISADVLKVGHHGSRFSSSPEFLKAVNPKVSIIEVGKNTYGHPTPAALGRLADIGTQIFRTDKNGTIKMIFDGERLRIYN